MYLKSKLFLVNKTGWSIWFFFNIFIGFILISKLIFDMIMSLKPWLAMYVPLIQKVNVFLETKDKKTKQRRWRVWNIQRRTTYSTTSLEESLFFEIRLVCSSSLCCIRACFMCSSMCLIRVCFLCGFWTKSCAP